MLTASSAPDGHGEYIYENARVPAENVIWGEGRAFDIAQGRLGPGRIHHCMRLVGQAERAYEFALLRCMDERKKPRGRLIGSFDSNIERIAQMRLEIDSMKLVVMNAADTMDIRGNKAGRYVIAQSKIMVPEKLAAVIDDCMQVRIPMTLNRGRDQRPASGSSRYMFMLTGSIDVWWSRFDPTHATARNVDIC
jgi:acyl-CoA dehydrogenase